MAHTTQDDGHDGAVRFEIWLTAQELRDLLHSGEPLAIHDGAVEGGHVEVVVRRLADRG